MAKHLQGMLLDLFCDITTPSARERFLEFSHGRLSLAKTNLNDELQLTVDCLCKFLVDVVGINLMISSVAVAIVPLQCFIKTL